MHSTSFTSTARFEKFFILVPVLQLTLFCLSKPLLQKPLSERRQILREHFVPVVGEFDFAKSSDGDTTEAIQTFLEESVKDGCEGLMIKMLDTEASYYEPSRRSVNWLKVCYIFCFTDYS